MQKYWFTCLLCGIVLNCVAQQKMIKVIEKNPLLTQIEENFVSKHLQRDVRLTLIYPKLLNNKLPVLFFNDGQDFEALKMKLSISTLLASETILPFFCVGIHANHDRIQEYGTASQADYKQRGAKAKHHQDFLIEELLPMLIEKYGVQDKGNVIAGLSLGGLSAMDIGWHNAQLFAKIGVFSGALWWRQKSEEDGYTDENDRIIHNLVRAGIYQPNLKFWFEAGTNDEQSDRNNNGIIDAIDDTLDLMKELEKKGYQNKNDFVYVEIKNGEHNTQTWSEILPDFLIWAFGK
jgi:iron(III)-enterobactin esterase